MPFTIPSVAPMPSNMTADLLLPLLFILHHFHILHLFFTKVAKEPELPLATATKLPIVIAH
jgi:hypothetical protein